VPKAALHDLAQSDDRDLTRMALGVLALARGMRPAGELLLDFTDDELGEMFAAYRNG